MGTPTRQQIIEATLNKLGEKAGTYITTREIAKVAGVNIAAINYHFGTKAMLLDEAMASLLDRVYGLLRDLSHREQPPLARLRCFCQEFLRISGHYPGIIKNIVGALIFDEQTSPRIMALIPPLVNTLTEVIEEMHPELTQSRRVFRAGNMLMALIFPQVFSQYYQQMVSLRSDSGSAVPNRISDEYLEMLLEQV